MSLRPLVACSLTLVGVRAQSPMPVNLALQAQASASESQSPQLAPRFAIDGDPGTRWSGIPGHNQGVWFELDWPQPITLRQVVLQQYDTYVKELDLQVWDAGQSAWRTLR